MGLKDMIAKARTSATGALARHRNKIDRGIDTVGEVANTRTGGRYATRIRKGGDQARAGLDKIAPDRPGPDEPLPTQPGPR
ncbi:antitoxin [Agrococcus sp. TSP3-2-1]|uniref:antitoxin n=1 Tax=Agrococcus sp. TSP3-2-1 TaxID=2804583 RepID=UPI003CF50C18